MKTDYPEEYSKHIYSRNSMIVKSLSEYSFMLLEKAEKLYGKRVNIFEYDGIEACDTFPGLLPLIDEDNNMRVRIQIPMSVLQISEPTVFVLGQYLFHVLCYDGKTSPNVLQTGAALYFADVLYTFIHDDAGYVEKLLSRDKEYFHLLSPYDAVKELLRVDSKAIFLLREIQPVLGKITKKDFKKTRISVRPELLNYLLSGFDV
ncbi:MAG: hypothetical protein ACOZCO_10660 [Bacteroidota bacterium]